MRKLLILITMAFLVLVIATSLLLFESLMGEMNDYSVIIWNFAISIAVVIIVITVIMYRRRKKKKEKKEKKEVVYYETEDKGDYRTEYY